MNYKELMNDCVSYINTHLTEKLSVEKLGKIYSCKGEYLSWMFQCYYKETLENYEKIALWWHDEDYDYRYMQGELKNQSEESRQDGHHSEEC